MSLLSSTTFPNQLHDPSFPSHHTPKTRRSPQSLITCSQKNPSPHMSLDRRGMLIGLGGLYGVAGSTNQLGMAGPAITQEPPNCHLAKAEVVDFEFPSASPMRVRRAAHLVDDEYVAKYKEGIRKMKELPESHPWNLYNHAMNHPATVHDGWMFLPWHRLYLHFFERKLGKLVGDDTFALPFWNFDAPDGMSLPALFADPTSPLYNPTRNPAHMPPAILDLGYAYNSRAPETEAERNEQIRWNLEEMKAVFRQSLARADLFMGDPPTKEGEEPPSSGRLDGMHKGIHQWVGPHAMPWMDMGNLHTSAKDPIFFSLHANLDRLWDIYKTFRGNRVDFPNKDWLDASFIFHDENGQRVRATVRDALHADKLRYTYEEVPIPWASRLPRKRTSDTKPAFMTPVSLVPVTEFGSEPKTLNSPVRVMVPRPKANRTNLEKEEQVEVLHIKGIDVVPKGPAQFDVFIAALEDGRVGPDHGIFAGSFIKPLRVKMVDGKVQLPEGKQKKGGLKLGISSVVNDLEAESADKLVVTFVPREGEITVGGVGIKLLPTDGPVLI